MLDNMYNTFDDEYTFKQVPSNDNHIGDCFWGKLASNILTQNWDQSLQDLNHLREFIDKNEVIM